MTREEAKNLLREIVEDYGCEITLQTLNTWARHLENVEVEQAKKAYKDYFENDQKGIPPKISQIISIIKSSNPRRDIFYAKRPTLHWNKFGELEDDEGRIYLNPNWTEEDIKRNGETMYRQLSFNL